MEQSLKNAARDVLGNAAASSCRPVTLELGGKSAAIVDRSADLAEAAARIACAKRFNAGQTCIVPDYALVPAEAVEDFGHRLEGSITGMVGTDPGNADHTSIISERHHARLEHLVADAAAQGARIMQEVAPITANRVFARSAN
jgi:coniferyl-aldehyde dehydrogenase